MRSKVSGKCKFLDKKMSGETSEKLTNKMSFWDDNNRSPDE
ncbi:hypothetical protein L579_2944 [Pantoea sp. AS-PWVM4]|nr:hypothetical protein L579_2944 [Pantoea sp. AS-PWVM4]